MPPLRVTWLKALKHGSNLHIFLNGANYPVTAASLLDVKECQELYPQKDCDEVFTFTEVVEDSEKLNYFDDKEILIQHRLSMVPSYIVSNQVKIENVDYVTYIFGAAGTWFGFCFLMVNPVQIIDWIYEKKVEPQDQGTDCKGNEISLVKNEIKNIKNTRNIDKIKMKALELKNQQLSAAIRAIDEKYSKWISTTSREVPVD